MASYSEAMIPIYVMDMARTLHEYCRETDFTHKKRRVGYDMAQYIAYFEVSVYHSS